MSAEPDASLDPTDWQDLRQQGHRMPDDMFDYVANIRARPVWQPIPPSVRESFSEALPLELPEHDVAFIAISKTSQTRDLLDSWPAPSIRGASRC